MIARCPSRVARARHGHPSKNEGPRRSSQRGSGGSILRPPKSVKRRLPDTPLTPSANPNVPNEAAKKRSLYDFGPRWDIGTPGSARKCSVFKGGRSPSRGAVYQWCNHVSDVRSRPQMGQCQLRHPRGGRGRIHPGEPNSGTRRPLARTSDRDIWPILHIFQWLRHRHRAHRPAHRRPHLFRELAR